MREAVVRTFVATMASLAFAMFLVVAMVHPATAAEKAALPAVKVCTSVSCKTGHGTGFALWDGYFITAAHVVSTRKEMYLRDSNGHTQVAKVIWISVPSDFALLWTDGADFMGLPPTLLYCGEAPAVGTKITNIGNPGPLEFISVVGRVVGEEQDFGPWKKIIPLTLPVFGGNSGSPVFNEDGQVMGIIVGGLRGTQFTGMEPMSKVCDILPIRELSIT